MSQFPLTKKSFQSFLQVFSQTNAPAEHSELTVIQNFQWKIKLQTFQQLRWQIRQGFPRLTH